MEKITQEDFALILLDPVSYTHLGFVQEMKDQEIRMIPIIDAGVKVEPGYEVYEEGVKNNYFCKREDGSDFVAAVWPGDTHFPDVLNKDARKWFGDKYRFLTDQGIEGFWNDMNEPAIFYSSEGLAEAKALAAEFAEDTEAVSYTHLDVYKRQVQIFAISRLSIKRTAASRPPFSSKEITPQEPLGRYFFASA